MSKKYVLIWSAVFLFVTPVTMAFTDKSADEVINEMSESVCFTNGEEYSANLDKIPVMFRKEPVLLGFNGEILLNDVTAIVKISVKKIDNGILHYELNSWQGFFGGHKPDASEINRICFGSVKGKKTKRMVVELKNKVNIVGEVDENKNILKLWTQEDVKLKIIDPNTVTQYENIIRKRADLPPLEPKIETNAEGTKQ